MNIRDAYTRYNYFGCIFYKFDKKGKRTRSYRFTINHHHVYTNLDLMNSDDWSYLVDRPAKNWDGKSYTYITSRLSKRIPAAFPNVELFRKYTPWEEID